MDDQEALVLESPRDLMAQKCEPKGRSGNTVIYQVALGALLVMGAVVTASHFAGQGGHDANVSATSELAADGVDYAMRDGTEWSLRRDDDGMVITPGEGKDIAEMFFRVFADHVRSANKDPTYIMNMFTETCEWDWSGDQSHSDSSRNRTVKGWGTPEDLFKGPTSVFGGSWFPMMTDVIDSNVFHVVDSGAGVISTTFDAVLLLTGHGKVPVDGTSTVLQEGILFELVVEKDQGFGQMKIKSWKSRWNTMNPKMGVAIAALAPASTPAPQEAVMTFDEGNDFAKKVLAWHEKGFAINDFSSNEAEDRAEEVFADNVAWDWSGGVKGKGSPADLIGTLSKTWLPMISYYAATDKHITVDPIAGEIYISHVNTLFMDGHGLLRVDEDTTSRNNIMFEFHVQKFDGYLLATHWRGVWDSKDPGLVANVKAVTAAMNSDRDQIRTLAK